MESPKSEVALKQEPGIVIGKTPQPAANPTPTDGTDIKINGQSLGFFHLPGGMDVPKLWDDFKKKHPFEGDKAHAYPIMFPKDLGITPDTTIKAVKDTIKLEI